MTENDLLKQWFRLKFPVFLRLETTSSRVREMLAAQTVLGSLNVIAYHDGSTRWNYELSDGDESASGPCDSIDDGIQQATAYYVEQMLPALERVEGTAKLPPLTRSGNRL